jgi:hypothetical protein
MSYTPLTITQVQSAEIDVFDAALDNAFGAGVDVNSSTVNIQAGNLKRDTTSNPPTVTANANTAHTFIVGDTVKIAYSGTADPNYPAGPKVVTAVSGNTFQYIESGSTLTSTASVQPATANEHITEMVSYSNDTIMSQKDSNGNPIPGTALVARTNIKGTFKSMIVALLQEFQMTQLITNVTGIPGPTTFSAHGGTIQFNVSASGWTTAAPIVIGYNIYVDGVRIGATQVLTNESSSHKACVPAFLVVSGLSVGTHTLTFSAYTNTIGDGSDTFNVTLLEMPV